MDYKKTIRTFFIKYTEMLNINIKISQFLCIPTISSSKDCKVPKAENTKFAFETFIFFLLNKEAMKGIPLS